MLTANLLSSGEISEVEKNKIESMIKELTGTKLLKKFSWNHIPLLTHYVGLLSVRRVVYQEKESPLYRNLIWLFKKLGIYTDDTKKFIRIQLPFVVWGAIWESVQNAIEESPSLRDGFYKFLARQRKKLAPGFAIELGRALWPAFLQDSKVSIDQLMKVEDFLSSLDPGNLDYHYRLFFELYNSGYIDKAYVLWRKVLEKAGYPVEKKIYS